MTESALSQDLVCGIGCKKVPVSFLSRSSGEILFVGEAKLANEVQFTHNSNYIRLI